MIYHIMTFDNTHTAIMVQKKCQGILEYAVCPVLREISASCGIAIRFKDERAEIISFIKSIDLEGDMYHLYEVNNDIISKIIVE